MSNDLCLSVELNDFVGTYDRRSRIIDEISKIVGVDTVNIRFPDESPTGLLGRMLDVNLDATITPELVCEEIEKISGVAEAKLKPTYQIPWIPGLNGPSSPAP